MQRNAPPPARSCQRKASPQEQDHRRQNAPDIPCQPMIPSNAPPGYNTPGYAHSPIPLAGDQRPEKHPKSADQADEQPIPPVMLLLASRCSSTVLILDIPHRFNSLYQKPLCCGPSPYSKQGCDAKNVSLSLENERSQCVLPQFLIENLRQPRSCQRVPLLRKFAR